MSCNLLYFKNNRSFRWSSGDRICILYSITVFPRIIPVPQGLLPKCTPAIHSNNPLFWSQRNQTLNHLAKTQLQLLIEETENQITALETILNEQLEALKTAVYDHATYIHLSDLIDNMAFNLRNNLDLRRSSKLKRILPS